MHHRDPKDATDYSPISDTIKAVLKESEGNIDNIVLLQPTSPIKTGKQIDEAIELLIKKKEANSLISVVPMDDIHPARMYWKNEDNILASILQEYEVARRQDIPVAYFRNGAIYIVRRVAFEKFHSVMIAPSIGYIMPDSHLLNIDSPRDILIAEPLIKAWKSGKL